MCKKIIMIQSESDQMKIGVEKLIYQFSIGNYDYYTLESLAPSKYY